jgi:sugar phosphate isomerase/epimerase
MLTLSTRWCGDDLSTVEAILRRGPALGFTAFELGPGRKALDPDAVFRLCQRERLRIVSIHHRFQDASGTHTSGPGGLIGTGLRAAELARRLGATHVVLSADEPDPPPFLREALRTLRAEGTAGDPAKLRAAAATARRDRQPWLETLLRDLFDLTRREREVRFCLKTSDRIPGLPDLEEAEVIFGEVRAANLLYWHDAGRATLAARLGFPGPEAWLDRFGRRAGGASLHDTAGAEVGLPPGAGVVDFRMIREMLAPHAVFAVDPDPRFSGEDVVDARRFLEGLGFR